MGRLLKRVYAAAILLLVVGGMAWGYMGMMGKNLVSKAAGKYAWVIYGLVGVSAVVVLATGRNAFLPFLGPTVFPCAALVDKVPDNADTTVEVDARPGTKVMYWGAEPDTEYMKGLKTWKEAYGAYANSGVAMTGPDGKAVLRLRKPQPYKVPSKGRLESHVHYRMCLADGWMSQVETVVLHSEPFVDLAALETFQVMPTEPVRPVMSTPELPVIADPVSGLPTAVPADVLPPKEEEKANVAVTTGIEGFSNEPVYSSSEGTTGPLGNIEAEDPRLLRLRSSVEADALKAEDSMGYLEGQDAGTALDAAFPGSLRPTAAPARRS